jgi:putative ABC transport system ATP-binding protein
MSLLELRNISRSYGEGSVSVNALHDVSLSVDQGEMVAVMGPSGSGKSSLLTIAGTLEEPTSGAVLINGKDVHAMSPGPRRECAAARSATSSRTSTCCPG